MMVNITRRMFLPTIILIIMSLTIGQQQQQQQHRRPTVTIRKRLSMLERVSTTVEYKSISVERRMSCSDIIFILSDINNV